jgi:aryl-alcohol dehydrogenase-like predicted oxidoreductase
MVADEPELQRLAISRALELGITYFDTAPVYGDSRSERALGRALRAIGARPLIASKVALTNDQLGGIADAVVTSVEGSLERLGCDSLDVVYLHNRVAEHRSTKSDARVGVRLTVEDVLGKDGVVDAFERLRGRGLIRFFGCCAYGGDMAALDTVISSDKFDAMLVHYNLINQTALLPAVPGSTIPDYGRVAVRAASRGMGIVVLRVLEAGLLADNAREAVIPDYARDAERASKLEFLRDERGTLAGSAIRFALSTGIASTVLIGVSELQHIEEAVEAAQRGSLSPMQLAKIETIRANDFR